MRILVANFFPAHFPPRSGGEQRYFHLYHHLSRWHDVTLLSANYPDKPLEYLEHSPSFREYRVPKPQVSDQLHWELYQAGIGDECSGFVMGVSGAVEGSLRKRFRELLQYADIVVHECPFTFTLDETAYSDGKPRVYASYNVEHRLAAQMLKGESGAAAASFIRFVEEMLVARADLVFATSEDERVQFAADFGADPAKVRLAPNGFEPEPEPDEATPAPAGEAAAFAVFLGSGHPPNVEAGRFICDALAPALPGVEFRIMGAVCSRLGEGVPPNVKLLGFVEEGEMRRQLRTCAAALNPLFSGAGTNLKMLQYMEAGAPILTSEIGARGLDIERDVEALVREPSQFADELRGLLAEPHRGQALGTAARRKAYSRHSWGEIAGRYARALEELPLSVSRGARTQVLHVNDYPVTDLMGGGQVRILEMLRELSGEFDVQLLCLTREGSGSEARIGRDARQRAFPITAAHHEAETRADEGQGISVRDIVAAEWVLGNEAFTAAFKAALPHAAAVVFEHPYLAPLLDLLPAHLPVVYASQNVETDLKRAMLAARRDGEHWATRAAELEERMASRADAIVAVCESDARVFRDRYPGTPVLLIENGVVWPSVPAAAALEGERVSAAFLGSSHPPNIDATRFILERLAPQLPGIDFHVVGSVCQAVAHLPRPGNVALHGVVSDADKARILGGCHMAINPVAVGGGSSLKVPDFLAAGLPLLSTATGARGFELQPGEHYVETSAEDFAAQLAELARDPGRRARIGRAGRRAIRRMAWPALGARYRRFLRVLARRKASATPRILVATYRLMDPAPGGAESYLNHLLADLGTRPGVSLDVAACDVGSIQDHWHFSARYGAAPPDAATPRGVTRVFRFPLDPPAPDTFAKCRRLHSTWMSESCRQWRVLHDHVTVPCLLGGWNHPERTGEAVWRWSGVRAQVGVPEGFEAIRIEASSHAERVIALRPARGEVSELRGSGAFRIEAALDGTAQIVELEVDQPLITADDPRELGVAARRVSLRRNGEWTDVDMRADAEQLLRAVDSQAWIDSLIDLTEERDRAVDDLFLEVRGPHSRDMREWLEAHVHEYDAVIVQGTPFAPIAWVPPIARASRVPVALLPHFHVEDRYYHWQGYYRAFREADCVLAAPDSTKRQFFDRVDAAAELIPGGGIDLEEFTAERLAACRAQFQRAHPSTRPYALVLGRKAGGKRYSLALEAAAAQAGDPNGFDIVMIGPDDDGLPIDQPGVHYYGARPRDFVLGALAGSACLVNMSESESFGIVLLESWCAGRPVVVQRRCVAFTDLVRDGENGFLAETPQEIRACIRRYIDDPALAQRHAESGRETAKGFSWEALATRAYDIVVERLLGAGRDVPGSSAPRRLDPAPFVMGAARATLDLLASGQVHDADFEAFRQWPGLRVDCIMDIGANRGQSVASLHVIFPSAVIHSFEANPLLFPVLDEVAAALRGKCVVHRHGLGREDGSFKLYIPWAAGQPWLEESSTRRDYYDKPWVAQKFAQRGALELQEVTAAIRVGDAMGLDPQVIKIDVEGAENDVLHGMLETIRRAKPLLLVENSDWHRVTATLAELGYRAFRWEPAAGRLVPFHGATTNTFYLHEAVHSALAEMTSSTRADA